jgi:uncharacterized protein YjbJ (UPF0337 family)
MGTDDKIRDKAEEALGKAKEFVGEHTNDDELAEEGRDEQARAKLHQAGEHVKDAVHDAGEHLRDAVDDIRGR